MPESAKLGGKKIRSFEQFKDAVNAADKTLALQVARDGSRTFLAVKLDPKDKNLSLADSD